VSESPTSSAKLEISASRHFADWLAESRLSLAFTTYQAGKLFLIGLQETGRLSIFERTFNRCLGLACDGQSLWMSALFQLWRFENSLEPGQDYKGHDRLYVPQVAYTTGDIDIHDVAIDVTGRPVFVNTLFGCLATTDEKYSFQPIWQPRFLSKLAAEDRCHLNGLAMKDGRPAYVTLVAQSDVVDGWRDRRRDGGCVIDVETHAPVVTGLSMPHSPRWYQDSLWVLDSGNGYLCRCNTIAGGVERIAFCAGYLRGLAFFGHYAVVGTSLPRDKTFAGLALDEELHQRNAEARCGLQVIDLNTGDVVHWLRLEGVVTELYDVAILPNVIRPAALGFKTDEIRRTISLGPWTPLA
jgi:uncharacterized protein (TIGR03032 family)